MSLLVDAEPYSQPQDHAVTVEVEGECGLKVGKRPTQR